MYPIMVRILSYTFSLKTLCSLNTMAKEAGTKDHSRPIRLIIIKRYFIITGLSRELYFNHDRRSLPSSNCCHICMQDHDVDKYHYSLHIISIERGYYESCHLCPLPLTLPPKEEMRKIYVKTDKQKKKSD